MIRNRLLITFLLVLIPATALANRPEVTVSILPQKYFVEKIAGEFVSVNVMVAPGASPATYEPRPSQMARLGKSSLYFAIGVPFEKNWLDRFSQARPELPIIRTDKHATKRMMKAHHHGDEHGDAHEAEKHDAHKEEAELHPDPHIWLSPDLVATQVIIIRDALSVILPTRASRIRKNADAFLKEIRELDADIRTLIPNTGKERAFFVFHPSWGYFADAYGLEQIAIESEGKEPGPRQLAKLIRLAKEENATAIFIQPQFADRAARVIASRIGAEVVKIDPLAENWALNLRHAAKALARHAN